MERYKGKDKLFLLEEELNPLLEKYFQKELDLIKEVAPLPFRPPLRSPRTSAWFRFPSLNLKLAVAVVVAFFLVCYPLVSYIFALERVVSPLMEDTLNPLGSSLGEEEGVLWAHLIKEDPRILVLLNLRAEGFKLKEALLIYLISRRTDINPRDIAEKREQGLGWVEILKRYGKTPIKELITLRREVQVLKKLIEQNPLVVEGEVVQIDTEDKSFSLNTFPFKIKFGGAAPELQEKVEVEVKKENSKFRTEVLKLKLKETLPTTEINVHGRVGKVDNQKGIFYLEGNHIPLKATKLPQEGEIIKGKGRLKGAVIEVDR